MSLQDPIANMLTIIRNAQMVGKLSVTVPHSKFLKEISGVMKDEGYLQSIGEIEQDGHKYLVLGLRYHKGQPVIKEIGRISKNSGRVYFQSKSIPRYKEGLGIVIMTTPKGVMTGKAATNQGVGGEAICYVF